MIVPIYIQNNEQIEENLNLGFNKNKECMTLVDLCFRAEQLAGFWVDPEVNDDTGSQDIIFYLGGTSFRTPYNEDIIQMFQYIIEN